MGKFQCENCGAAMIISEDRLTASCEYCGTTISIPDTHPEYTEAVMEKAADGTESDEIKEEHTSGHKFKLTMLLIVIVIMFISACSLIITRMVFMKNAVFHTSVTELNEAQLSWPVTGNAGLLPPPSVKTGQIISDSQDLFSADLYQVTQSAFDTYAAECREYGFDVAAEGSDSSYSAYNADGYYIDLFYWEEEGELSIYLDAPEQITELAWPSAGLAAELPKPASEYGTVMYDDPEGISVVVYVDSKAEFDHYVEECKQYGFTEDHQFYFLDDRNGWYEADHANGHHLDITYQDSYYKKMEIRLDTE